MRQALSLASKVGNAGEKGRFEHRSGREKGLLFALAEKKELPSLLSVLFCVSSLHC